MKNVINNIRKELKQNVDLRYKKGSINFFKEPIRVYGVRTGKVRAIGRKYFSEIKDLSKQEVFKLCEELLKSDYNEEAIIAFAWTLNFKKEFVKQDFKMFENWVKKYVNNWAKCDDFCTHAFGELLSMYPELIPQVKKWTKSKNRWLRRASAVVFINPLGKRKKKYLKDAFWIADTLLVDPDDLVQKGYGWMLKVAADVWRADVYHYVLKNKKMMPRTALRYAIEKMPRPMKVKAMQK